MEISQVVTPKAFFVQERDRFYDSWTSSFWRELFQNSVDAGSKAIEITISVEPGKGSFGHPRTADEVIRINFNDDGHGMTQDVLDNVYFQLGASTKRNDNESVGGFGRARLMLAYANVRYSLVTGDRAVEGDGDKFHHNSISGMANGLASLTSDLLAVDPSDPRLPDLMAEESRLRELASSGGINGCHFQVDINTNEYPDRPYANPTVDKMMRTLTEYLKTSQVPCKVIVNGEERKEKLLKGPVKRTISAKGEDGEMRQFATVHTSRGDKANYKNQMIVRVDGATMFTTHIHADVQVVVELDKTMAREVMTSNRDSLKEPYSTAFDELKSEIILDTKSALDEDKLKSYTVQGALGRMAATRPIDNLDLKSFDQDTLPPISPDEFKAAVKLLGTDRQLTSTTASSELESNGYGGVPYNVLEKFINETRYGNTFLSDLEFRPIRDKIVSAGEGRHGLQRVKSSLDILSDDERNYLIGEILSRLEDNRRKAQEEFDSKLKGMPDVRIHTDGDITGKLLQAMRRNDPKNWDPATGQGIRARSLLAAWTIMCDEAINTLLKYHPASVEKDFEWTTGFVYSAPREEYRHRKNNEAMVTEAQHQKDAGDVHYLLINPVNSEGSLRYNPRDTMDLHYIGMLSAHEVAHISQSWHNEDFASLMTTIAGRMDLRAAAKRVNAALKDIGDIYREGKVRSQAMDDIPGIRPSERLLANAAPAAFVSSGIMASPENRHIVSPTLHVLSDSIVRQDDGTFEADCDNIQTLEYAATSGYRTSPEDEPESRFAY